MDQAGDGSAIAGCAHRWFGVWGARSRPRRPGSAPAEMRGADFAPALDGCHERAKFELDVAFVAADMDDCHPAGLYVFDSRQLGRALAEVTAQRGRHEVGEDVDCDDVALGRRFEAERQQEVDRIGVADVDFEVFLIGPPKSAAIPRHRDSHRGHTARNKQSSDPSGDIGLSAGYAG